MAAALWAFGTIAAIVLLAIAVTAFIQRLESVKVDND